MSYEYNMASSKRSLSCNVIFLYEYDMHLLDKQIQDAIFS